MTTAPKVDALNALRGKIQALGGTYALAINMRDQISIDKAEWLLATGRDFFSATSSLKGAMMLALQRSVSRAVTDGTPQDAHRAVTEAARAHIVRRFLEGGFDVRLRPLSRDWIMRKRRDQYDTRVGIMTGNLVRSVRLAEFSLVKVSG